MGEGAGKPERGSAVIKYVYIRYAPKKDGLGQRTAWFYVVGFYAPGGKWHPENEFATKFEAAERVHYLNGGK